MCVCECVISEGREVWPGGGREVYCVCFFPVVVVTFANKLATFLGIFFS